MTTATLPEAPSRTHAEAVDILARSLRNRVPGSTWEAAEAAVVNALEVEGCEDWGRIMVRGYAILTA